MNIYNCINCGSQANKKACEKGSGTSSLGTWQCPKCGSGAKVKVTYGKN